MDDELKAKFRHAYVMYGEVRVRVLPTGEIEVLDPDDDIEITEECPQ